MTDDFPTLFFASPGEYETWLEQNHGGVDGIWVKIAKKGSGIDSVRYPEVLDLSLCFGWIDGQRQALDETHFLQKFTPRRSRSRWSKINREKAEALIATGSMRPAGLAQVEAAKSDGRWEAAYEGQASAEVPEDLQTALDASAGAAKFFAGLDGQNRYAILYRLQDAKRPETRERRLAKFVAMLEREEKLHP